MTISDKKQLSTIQILRAIASTSIVYYHINTSAKFGSFGIDIFFIISGFVMAMMATNGETAKNFAINRISRIVPLYWLITSFVLLLAAIKPALLDQTTANLINYLKSLLFIPYFRENGQLHPMLGVGWTLNYEMFFYFSVWLIILFNNKYAVWKNSLLILGFYFLFGNFIENKLLNEFFANKMIIEFIFGMIVFIIYEKNYLSKISSKIMLIVAVILYIFMSLVEVVATQNAMEINKFFLYGIPSFILVLSFVHLEEIIPTNKFSKILVDAGNASYATYLSHIFVVKIVINILAKKFNLLNVDNIFVILVTLVVALAIGHFIYIFIDKPLSCLLKKNLLAF